MLRVKSCGAVVYKYIGDKIYVLLVKHNAGHWSFASIARWSFGSKNEETAIREIKEETNLDVAIDSNFRFVNTYSYKNTLGKDVFEDVIYFVGCPLSDNLVVQVSELSDVKWYKVDDAYSIITYDSDTEVLRKAIEYITYEEKN